MKQKNKLISKIQKWPVPVKTTACHPHLLRKHGLLITVLVLIGLQLSYNLSIAREAQILGNTTSVFAQAITTELNASRQAHGQAALVPDIQLNKAASLKADNMLKVGYWAHNAPDGSQPWRWFDTVGYKYQLAGENLAKDFRTPDGVISAWLNSETHRKNVLNADFKDIGVAVVKGTLNGKDTTLIVALFGSTHPTMSVNKTGNIIGVTKADSVNILANPAQIKALMNPLGIATAAVLLGLLTLALLTYRRSITMPKNLHHAWYKYHALYITFIILAAIIYIIYIFTLGTI